MQQDAWRAYLDFALGLTESSRRRAQKVAVRLLGQGGATANQLQSLAEELVETAAANRQALVKLVRLEIDGALGRVGLATAEEVAELNDRVRELERRLRESPAGVGDPAPTLTTPAGAPPVDAPPTIAPPIIAAPIDAPPLDAAPGGLAGSTGSAPRKAASKRPPKKARPEASAESAAVPGAASVESAAVPGAAVTKAPGRAVTKSPGTAVAKRAAADAVAKKPAKKTPGKAAARKATPGGGS